MATVRACSVDDPVGLHYEGAVLIHGMVTDPESSFPPELMSRFAPYGTIISSSDGEEARATFIGQRPDEHLFHSNNPAQTERTESSSCAVRVWMNQGIEW